MIQENLTLKSCVGFLNKKKLFKCIVVVERKYNFV